MKKSENLIATVLAVYAIILTLCIAIYAIFKSLEVDITLATNLLLWSAAIFAPIVLIFTFNNWKKEKSSELISKESRDLIVQMKVFSDGTKQLIGKIFCNYMHELENSNLQRFFPKKVDKSQLLNEWSNMYALRLQIHEKLYLITFNNNDAELMHKIEIYNSLIEQIDAYFHLNKDDLNDYSFLQKFTSSMESLIDELYSYSLFQKTIK